MKIFKYTPRSYQHEAYEYIEVREKTSRYFYRPPYLLDWKEAHPVNHLKEKSWFDLYTIKELTKIELFAELL